MRVRDRVLLVNVEADLADLWGAAVGPAGVGGAWVAVVAGAGGRRNVPEAHGVAQEVRGQLRARL